MSAAGLRLTDRDPLRFVNGLPPRPLREKQTQLLVTHGILG